MHICSDVPAEQMAYMKENLPDNLRIAPYLGTYYLPVKVEKEKLADPRVRQAISMLIDRDFIAEEVWQGTMLPGLLAGAAGHRQLRRDAAAARLCRGRTCSTARTRRWRCSRRPASTRRRSQIELRYNSSENHKNTMAAIADMLSNVGITAILNEMEGTGYFKYLQEGGDFDIVRAGWIGDYNDPQNFLYLNQTGVSFNYPRWSNEDYDDQDDGRRRDHRPRGPRTSSSPRPSRSTSTTCRSIPILYLLLPRAGLRQGRRLGGQPARPPRHALAVPERVTRPGGPRRRVRRPVEGGCDAGLHAPAAGERDPDGVHHRHADLLHDPAGAGRPVRPRASARPADHGQPQPRL